METQVDSLCSSCVHFIRVVGWDDAVDGPPACEAFHLGIPVDIWFHGGDHIDPRPGDNGLQYQPLPGREDALDQWRDRRDNEDERSGDMGD